jgi:hypothetical protein
MRSLGIELTKVDLGHYEVRHENGVKMGEFLMGDDGYYTFWPELRAGYWDQMILASLVQKLKELNDPWDQQIQAEQWTLHPSP